VRIERNEQECERLEEDAGAAVDRGVLRERADAEITQLPATLLALFGIDSDLDGAPLEPILERAGAAREAVTVAATATSEESVYAEDEEAAMLERLRDLGYE
jgi:hypothetical protein